MLRRFSFGFRVFLYTTALVTASRFVLSASGFLQLVFLWGGYATVLSVVGVARRGWWRGLCAPAIALAAMAYVGGRDAASLCFVAGLLSILLSSVSFTRDPPTGRSGVISRFASVATGSTRASSSPSRCAMTLPK